MPEGPTDPQRGDRDPGDPTPTCPSNQQPRKPAWGQVPVAGPCPRRTAPLRRVPLSPARARPGGRAPRRRLRGARRTTAPASGQVGSDLSHTSLHRRQRLTFPCLPCPPNPRLLSTPAPLSGCEPPQLGKSGLSFDSQFRVGTGELPVLQLH